MHAFPTRTMRLTTFAGAALLIAGCGGGGDAVNESAANTLDANVMLEQPGNDASAMESVVNAPEPVVTEPTNQTTDSNEVLGETKGGDTGGNVIENISGM